MKSSVRLAVVACAAVVLAVGLVTAATGTDEQLAMGQIYATDEGDPVDVLAETGDEPGIVCTNVGGFFYGSSISCFELRDADRTGSYQLVVPESRRKPPLVVGVMPAGSSGATVRVSNREIHASTRGRWFLAQLETGSLGPNNANPVTLEFE